MNALMAVFSNELNHEHNTSVQVTQELTSFNK